MLEIMAYFKNNDEKDPSQVHDSAFCSTIEMKLPLLLNKK